MHDTLELKRSGNRLIKKTTAVNPLSRTGVGDTERSGTCPKRMDRLT